jgi:hypothetical protein
MPRKKTAAPEAAQDQTTTAIVLAEPRAAEAPQQDQGEGPIDPRAKNWGDPYKAIFTTEAFELGENRRFKQRVFMFKEKPSDEVLARLKDEGFTYRANEKAWTIEANPDTRKLTDDLAREFAGPSPGVTR